MSNNVVVTVLESEEDTIVLIQDNHAKSFLMMASGDFQQRTWGDVWYDLLTEDGFDDVLQEVEADHVNCVVKLDEDNLPITKDPTGTGFHISLYPC